MPRPPLALVGLLLAGCWRERYPDEWGPVQPLGVAPGAHAGTPIAPHACPWLGGTFRDVGIGKGPIFRLSRDALGVGEAERAAFDRTELGRTVELTQYGDDSLAVTVHGPGVPDSLDPKPTPPGAGVRTRRTLSRADGDYECGQGGLERAWWDGHSGEGVLALSRMSVQLTRAADGALVLRQRDTVGGIMLLLPIAGRDELWYRFTAAELPSAGAP